MTWPSQGLGDHRRENMVHQRSDPVLLCPLPRLSISGTVSAPIQTPGRQCLSKTATSTSSAVSATQYKRSPKLFPEPRVSTWPPTGFHTEANAQAPPSWEPAAHPSPLPLTSHSLSPRLLPPNSAPLSTLSANKLRPHSVPWTISPVCPLQPPPPSPAPAALEDPSAPRGDLASPLPIALCGSPAPP